MVDRKLAEADNGVGFYLCVGVGGNRCSIGVYAWPPCRAVVAAKPQPGVARKVSKRGAMFFYAVP